MCSYTLYCNLYSFILIYNFKFNVVIVEIIFQLFLRERTFFNNDITAAANDVSCSTTININNICFSGDIVCTHDTLFTIDTWEITIWCKTIIWLFIMINIIFQAGRTCFFITSHDQTNSLIHWNIHILDDFHCNHAGNNATLIIRDTSSIKNAILFNHCIWICIPSIFTTCRNNIKMTNNCNQLISFTHFTISNVVI